MLFFGRNVVNFLSRESVGIKRMLQAFCVNLKISTISAALSIFFGTILGFLVGTNKKIFYFLFKIFLEVIRIIPIFAWLFFLYFKMCTKASLEGEKMSILVFSIWGTFEFADVVLCTIQSIPKHQFESALAIGLTNVNIYKKIITPQIFKMLMPNAVNLITRMIKTTSIVTLIGVTDVLKVGHQIIECNVFKNPSEPIFVYGFIFFLFFAVCYTTSLFSRYLEKKLNVKA